MHAALTIRLDGHSTDWLEAARALVREAGHRLWTPRSPSGPDVVLAEERLIAVPPGALGIVAGHAGDAMRRRLEALLQRPEAVEVPLTDGRIELAAERVVRDEIVPLTAVEAALVRRLVRAEGRTVARADLLRDVWGVGPKVQTRALDTAVRRLRAKIEPDRKRPVHLLTAHGIGYRFTPAPAPPEAPPHDLGPADEGPLFGRQSALATIERALSAHRWVTLVGPGGVGKSRLARACGRRILHRFRAGGAWLCDLADARNPAAVSAAVARALGLPGGAIDPGEALRARGRTLLVLDDIDRVQPDPGPLIAGWLAAAPELAVLVTGRRATGHPDEVMHEPGPLESADAVALFRHRSGLADDPAIATIVDLLDAVPLAVTLAADRARLLPPATLLERLRDPAAHVRLLRRPGDGRREGAIDRVLDASWALLDPTEQRVARRCAVFRGGFTIEAAEQVCAEPEALDALHTLAGLSIVRRVGGGRLALFETIRCWLALRLEAADEGEATAARHRAWCAALAAGFTRAPIAEQARRRPAITTERHNLRAAFDAGDALDPDARTALAVCLSTVFARTGPFDVALDAVRWSGDGAAPAWRARLACARARQAVRQGAAAEGWAALQPWIALADDALPPTARIDVLIDGARCAPDAETSRTLAEAADARCAAAGDIVGQAAARMIRARLDYRAGRIDKSMGHALRGIDAYRQAGVDDHLAPALANLAMTFTRRGSWPEARRCADEARRVARRIDDRATEAITVAIDGYIALHHEEFTTAAALLGDAVRRQRALALRGVRLHNQLLAGLATVLDGRMSEGRALVDDAARDAVAHGASSLSTLLGASSAALAAMAGEEAVARHRAEVARTGAEQRPSPLFAEATRLFLTVVDAADDHGRATQRLAEADVRATTELTVRCARWLLATHLAPRRR